MMLEEEKERIYSEIYTPIHRISDELRVRNGDNDLRQKVLDFFQHEVFPPLNDLPRAVLSTSIATPNMEFSRFLKLSQELKLSPLVLEYPDKFVAKNLHKYHLCKLFFFHTDEVRQSKTLNTMRIVNFNNVEGKLFSEIRTNSGDKITNVHHKFFLSKYPHLANSVIDFSSWFNKTRVLTEHYYLHYLSLFIQNGVLFENFIVDDKEESEFYYKKFLPSFRKAYEIFGVKPLICQLLPSNDEKSVFWYSYPASYHNEFASQILGKSAIISRWNLIFSKIFNIAMKLLKRFQAC